MKKKDSKNNSSFLSRRDFLTRSAMGMAGIVFVSKEKLFASSIGENPTWPADATEYRFHMIGHAHIDPVWLWPWEEGMAVIHSTFRSILDRMNETSDFAFIASSAQFYEWVAENDPAMIEEISKRVDEGRWNIVGGWWVEPDVNMPCGESLARQGLYGQKTFQRLLGRKARVGFNPDSFGHPGTLPQILKLQSLNYYVFMRPAPLEKKLPADLFQWKSSDGSQVLTYRIPFSYNETQSVNQRVAEILERLRNQPMKSLMAFYGAGDHGGGPTKANIRSIEELKGEKGAPAVFFSTIDKYFDEIEKQNLNLPVVNEDLQHHSVGCYTAGVEIKKGNRQSETALVTAEKLAAIGSQAWGATYPKGGFTSAWQRVLFLQFHDSLAGTSLPEHFVTAREGYDYALDIAHQIAYKTLQKLESQVPTEDSASEYLIVFNPNASETKKMIEYDFDWSDSRKSSRVEDEKGNSLLHQWTAASTEAGIRKKLIVEVPLPSFGYRQIRLLEGNTPEIKNGVTVKADMLENEFYLLRFFDDGEVSITDKQTGSEVFSGKGCGCKAVVIDDQSDTWSHDIRAFLEEIGSFGNAKITPLLDGPLKATIRVVSTYGKSTLTIDWSLTKGSRNIEAVVTLDWHEHLKMLKFSFPVNIDSTVATYEVPYGYIVRDVNGDENPGQRWIDLTGRQKGKVYGLTVINDAKYGYNVIGNDMRISVARSAVFAHHLPKKLSTDKEYRWMDQGIHTFRMLLLPHEKSWQESRVTQLSEEFMTPPLCIYQGIHEGTLPKSNSFISVDKPNIIISSIKEAEDNNDMIIRCVETSGMATTAGLDLSFMRQTWKGNFRPCEIKTLRINRSSGKIIEVNLLEEA